MRIEIHIYFRYMTYIYISIFGIFMIFAYWYVDMQCRVEVNTWQKVLHFQHFGEGVQVWKQLPDRVTRRFDISGLY